MNKPNGTILAIATVAACLAAVSISPVTSAGVLNPAPVAKTGQTTPYVSGDDGDLQKGVGWPSPRFMDNQDGTVTDHLTGLVWLKDATRFTARSWNQALNACNNLADDGVDLTDGSVAGDWRLPNNKEQRRIIDFGNVSPALPDGHPFTVPANGALWTSTTAINNTGRAWTIEDGTMVNDPKGTFNLVWCVRDSASGGYAPAPIPKTGQTISYGSRDDGELQKGVEWPDPRFTNNLDGTVTDHLTGLIWLRNANSFPNQSFASAVASCNALADNGTTLTDGSEPGEWRLPNFFEIGSLTDFSQIGPSLPVGHPFLTTNAGTFWTSTTTAANSNRAWAFGLGIGRLSGQAKGVASQVWPVRGANRVAVDIKPGSCPNPVNVRSRGGLPVAILGTADLDVTMIDPVTIRLAGVAPIRSSVEDVGTPVYPFVGKEDCDLDCAEEGPDGWPDLTLKFDTQLIARVLGEAEACQVLTLTGHLLEEYGSAPIEGEDVVLVLNRGVGGRSRLGTEAGRARQRPDLGQENGSHRHLQRGD